MKKKLIFVIIVSLISFAIYKFGNIKVNEVSCSSQYGPCNNEVSTFLRSLEGKSLRSVKKVTKVYLEENSSIQNFSVQYNLTNKFKISVIERKPHFALKFVNHNKNALSLIDFEGFVLSFQESSSFPLVETKNSPVNVGEKVDSETLFSLEIVGYLRNYYDVEKGEINSDLLTVFLKSGKKVLFPTSGDKELLVSALGVILGKLESEKDNTDIEVNRIKTIDLRFNNPVLR